MKTIMLGAVALSVLVGCAGRTPNPVALAQVHDNAMACQALQAEIAANTRKIGELGSDQGAKTAQNVAAGVAGLFIWPIWFAMDFQGAATKEIAALEARNNYLGQLALESCAASAQVVETPLRRAPVAAYYPAPVTAYYPAPVTSGPPRDVLTGQTLDVIIIP